MSHVLVLSTSLHHNSNSEILAQKLTEGIKDAGNQVEYISLKDKKISFCVGCLACQTTQKCVIKDDAVAIVMSLPPPARGMEAEVWVSLLLPGG